MSQNNQLLVKEYNGRFYIFDVMAETWGVDNDHLNELSLKESKANFPTREEAHKCAHFIDQHDEWFGSEYGVVDEVLYKDGAEVRITQ